MAYYILFNSDTGNYTIEEIRAYEYIEYGRISWYGAGTLRLYLKDFKNKDEYIEELKLYAINYHKECIERLIKVK